VANFDAADLLARVRELSGRDKLSSDAAMTDANFYRLLSDGQFYWCRQIAIHAPWMLAWTSATLTSADSGATYTFSSSITPLAVELYESSTGRFLAPGWYPDPSADYVWEGNKVRAVRGGTRTAPFCRYVVPPTVIDGSTPPTLTPDHARVLCVYRAAILWATRGDMRDATRFRTLEKEAWIGNPELGDVGILGWMKGQNPFYGMSAIPGQALEGLAYLNQVAPYTAI
jgi:hypothetical protein